MIEEPLLTYAEIGASVVMTEPEALKGIPAEELFHFAQQVAYIGAAKMLESMKPLDDSQRYTVIQQWHQTEDDAFKLISLVEAAHGITEEKNA